MRAASLCRVAARPHVCGRRAVAASSGRRAVAASSGRLAVAASSGRLAVAASSKHEPAARAFASRAEPLGGDVSLAKYGNVYGGREMSAAVAATFDVWHGLVEAVRDGGQVNDASVQRLRAVIADDCEFRPPTYFKPWTGGDETTVLLCCAAEVLVRAVN